MSQHRVNVPALEWLREHCGAAAPGACLLMPYAPGSHGYCSISVQCRKLLAHRYVCELFHGVPPAPHYQAAHSCGQKTCVNPHHLRWATRRENEADKKIHGTILTGQKNPAAKLSLVQVDEILHSLSSHRKIAAKYGVSSSTVGRIKRGENWGKHV